MLEVQLNTQGTKFMVSIVNMQPFSSIQAAKTSSLLLKTNTRIEQPLLNLVFCCMCWSCWQCYKAMYAYAMNKAWVLPALLVFPVKWYPGVQTLLIIQLSRQDCLRRHTFLKELTCMDAQVVEMTQPWGWCLQKYSCLVCNLSIFSPTVLKRSWEEVELLLCE